MAKLKPDTVLRRAPDLEIRLNARRAVVRIAGRSIDGGPHGLAVLAEFSRPRPLAEAVEALSGRLTGAHEWQQLTSTVRRFFLAGALLDEDAAAPAAGRPPAGFDAASVHVRMLDDRARTEAFLAAIAEVVRPGDVVVDLGTGTGVLALAAARAGARRVYAIEAGSICESAQAVFAAAGVADRVQLVRGWSSEVELPERADVLLSEIVGNDPLGERIVEHTADAARRFLKPAARLVPERIRILGLPVDVPAEVLAKHRFTAGRLERWRSWYGLDLGALAAANPRVPRSFLVDPYRARGWQALSEPVVFADLALGSERSSVIEHTAEATAVADGELSGVIVGFELVLGPTTELATRPAAVRRDNHWRSPCWIQPEPLLLAAGERFTLTYRHGMKAGREGVRARARVDAGELPPG